MVKGINTSSANLNFLYNNQNQLEQEKKQRNNNLVLPSVVTKDFNVKVPQAYTKLGVEKLSNGQEIHCYKLANGQKVMIAPMPSPKTCVNTYVNTGSMNEKDSERGISHYTEHMAFNGTFGTDGYMKLGVGDVFRKVAEMGGYTNASTGPAETNYTIEVPEADENYFETAIAMQAAMMNNLEMSDSMVEKEHGPVCQEINMYSDYMPLKANNIAMKNLYNIDSTSEDLVAGRVDNIQNIDRKKVMDYYKNNYYPANMTTVITGNINPDDAIKLVAKHFRGENKPILDRRFEKLSSLEKTIRKDIISDKAVTTNSTIAFNGPANNDIKNSIALDIALLALFYKSNARITAPLKELNADAHAQLEKVSTIPSDGQYLSIDIDTTEDNSEKVLNTIFKELNNFKLKEGELKQLKQAIKSKNQDNYEDPEKVNHLIGSNSFMLDIKDITNQDKILDSITESDVENAVKKYFDTGKASIAVVHPKSVTAESLNKNYQKVNSNINTVSFKGNRLSTLPFETSRITNYKLNNNYDIAFYDTPTNSNAKTIITYTPDKLINGKPGAALLLNRMLKDKTMNKDADAFGDYLDKYNINQNLLVMNGGQIQIIGKMPSENIQEFMNVTQEQLMMPCFDEESFKKQKEIVKDILKHDKPTAYDGLTKAMYPNTELGYTTKDILDNIDTLTLQDIKDYYSNIMQNSKATVAVVAPMSDRKVLNTTLNSFAKMPMVKPNNYSPIDIYNTKDKSVVVTDTQPNSQAEIMLAHNFKETGNVKDNVTFELLTQILSRGDETGLFNNLREKEKLAYSVHAEYQSEGNNSFIACNILTTTDNQDTKEYAYENVQKSIIGFNKQIEKMKNGEFTDAEVDIAKKELKNILKDRTYRQKNCMITLSEGLNSAYGFNLVNEKFNIIDKITKDDIQNAAKYAFAGKPIYSIVASKDTLNANKEYIESINNQ